MPPTLPPAWITPAQLESFTQTGTTAHRLASAPDGWIERLGNDVVISYKNTSALDTLLTGLASWSSEASWQAARIFTRFLPLKNADRISPVLHSGDPTLPLTTVVTESGINFGLDIAAGYSHGLFLDQRANRAKLRALRPKRLLNTFAYTCSFTIAAALEGAQTVSVDLSRKFLDRGKQNLALNNLPLAPHRFIADDTLDLLPTLYSRNERFDAIILDPPTFSRGNQGRRWQIEHDLEDLLNGALELALPQCAILLSTNCTKLDPISLERRARACAKAKRRTADYIRPTPLPDFPAGHGSTTLWMMLR